MPFSEKKATEAVGFLLKLAGGRDYLMRVLKLLYIADREAIARWGFFISNDRHVSMPFGPVLSNTYNMMKGQRQDAFWSTYISPRFGDHEIRLLQDCPTGSLSRAEEKLLSEVYANFGRVDKFQLSDYTHTFPEWTDPAGSSIPISAREILEAMGVPENEAKEILRDLRVSENVEEVLQEIG